MQLPKSLVTQGFKNHIHMISNSVRWAGGEPILQQKDFLRQSVSYSEKSSGSRSQLYYCPSYYKCVHAREFLYILMIMILRFYLYLSYVGIEHKDKSLHQDEMKGRDFTLLSLHAQLAFHRIIFCRSEQAIAHIN